MENGFYLTIPSYIIKNNVLTDTDKLIYGIVSNLGNEKGYCYCNNKYIIDNYNISKSTLCRSIQKLKNEKLIYIEIFNNNKRRIYVTNQVIQRVNNEYEELFDYDWLNENKID